MTGLAGTYEYGPELAFPASLYNGSNYFVDVTFAPAEGSPTPTPTPTPTATATAPAPSPTATTQSPTATPIAPTSTQPASPTPTTTSQAPSPTAGPTTPGLKAWPDQTNTGVVGCPPLEKVDNGDEVQLRTDGMVYENKELMNEAVIRVLAHNVTIRCVKMNGSGYFGIDNTNLVNPAPNANDTTVDRVDISCKDTGQLIGILLQSATVTRATFITAITS